MTHPCHTMPPCKFLISRFHRPLVSRRGTRFQCQIKPVGNPPNALECAHSAGALSKCKQWSEKFFRFTGKMEEARPTRSYYRFINSPGRKARDQLRNGVTSRPIPGLP